MSGGWLSTLKAVANAKIPNAYKRVILLTDGNPTLGIKDQESLVQIAKDHAAAGISTTTIGVGNDLMKRYWLKLQKQEEEITII